ncbi:MAG: BACON domain-containing protein [Rikenellaceae bacterium]
MKRYIKFTKCVAALSALLGFVACNSDDTQSDKEWVDPRYRNLEDSYTLAADGSCEIKFEIKSNMPWQVYNDNAEWCSITPESGDDAETTYEVVVKYEPNEELDDRVDVIYLKSDYWVFKSTTVTQTGIAKLILDHASLDQVHEDGTQEDLTFTFVANQDWSVAPAVSWIKITSAESGTISGKQDAQVEVSFSVDANKGENRSGDIELFDRNGELQASVSVSQAGLVLGAYQADSQSESTEFRIESTQAEVIEIDVKSNSQWYVVKADEEVAWYSSSDFPLSAESAVDGDKRLSINVDNYTGSAVRAAKFYLVSINQNEDGTPVIAKGITIKQQGNAKVTYEFENADYQIYTGALPTYQDDGSLYFSGAGRIMLNNTNSATPIGLYEAEYSSAFTAADGVTIMVVYENSSATYAMCNFYAGVHKSTGSASVISAVVSTNIADLDTDAKHTIGINVYEGESGYHSYDWLFDGEIIHSVEGSAVLNSAYDNNLYNVIVGCTMGTGDAYLHRWFYTPPTDWSVEPSDKSIYLK